MKYVVSIRTDLRFKAQSIISVHLIINRSVLDEETMQRHKWLKRTYVNVRAVFTAQFKVYSNRNTAVNSFQAFNNYASVFSSGFLRAKLFNIFRTKIGLT